MALFHSQTWRHMIMWFILALLHYRIKVDAEDGYMRHYRASKTNYIKEYGPLINDTWVAEWSKRIEGKVKAVRQRLFGSKGMEWYFQLWIYSFSPSEPQALNMLFRFFGELMQCEYIANTLAHFVNPWSIDKNEFENCRLLTWSAAYFGLNNVLFDNYHMTGSDITPCNKIDKPLVVYRFSENVMTSITT